jgi:hypothetical protein
MQGRRTNPLTLRRPCRPSLEDPWVLRELRVGMTRLYCPLTGRRRQTSKRLPPTLREEGKEEGEQEGEQEEEGVEEAEEDEDKTPKMTRSLKRATTTLQHTPPIQKSSRNIAQRPLRRHPTSSPDTYLAPTQGPCSGKETCIWKSPDTRRPTHFP